MNRVPRDDTMQQLIEQFNFLCEATKQFKARKIHFAKPMATALRVMLYHNPQGNRGSHALLAQLGVLDTMNFLDSCGEVDTANLTAEFNLVVVHHGDMNDPPSYFPITSQRMNEVSELGQTRFGREFMDEFQSREGRPKMLPWMRVTFADWWKERVIKTREGDLLTRADLIKDVANTDGGAHVDPALREVYARLSRPNALGGTLRPTNNPVPPMIYQIGYEVRESLGRQYPELRELYLSHFPQASNES